MTHSGLTRTFPLLFLFFPVVLQAHRRGNCGCCASYSAAPREERKTTKRVAQDAGWVGRKKKGRSPPNVKEMRERACPDKSGQ